MSSRAVERPRIVHGTQMHETHGHPSCSSPQCWVMHCGSKMVLVQFKVLHPVAEAICTKQVRAELTYVTFCWVIKKGGRCFKDVPTESTWPHRQEIIAYTNRNGQYWFMKYGSSRDPGSHFVLVTKRAVCHFLQVNREFVGLNTSFNKLFYVYTPFMVFVSQHGGNISGNP